MPAWKSEMLVPIAMLKSVELIFLILDSSLLFKYFCVMHLPAAIGFIFCPCPWSPAAALIVFPLAVAVIVKHFYFPDEDWGAFMFSFVLNCVLIFVALLLVALIFPPCLKWAFDTFYSMY